MARLRLAAQAPFLYRPGQFVELITPEGVARHYSIASVPEEDDFLELHIRLRPSGRMSGFIRSGLRAGDSLRLAGPSGVCVYDDGSSDRPLVLVGAGTGLAPLWGILRDAQRRGHRAPIRLYHGARNSSGLYLDEELRERADLHDNFAYLPRAFDAAAAGEGDIAAAVIANEADLAGSDFFLCGGEGLVSRLKRELFLRGARLNRIRSDAFSPAT